MSVLLAYLIGAVVVASWQVWMYRTGRFEVSYRERKHPQMLVGEVAMISILYPVILTAAGMIHLMAFLGRKLITDEV